MHNNLNILEMKQVLELQPFSPSANRLNIWQLNNLSHWLKDNLDLQKVTARFSISSQTK